jgi:hypothetical protein
MRTSNDEADAQFPPKELGIFCENSLIYFINAIAHFLLT